MPNRIIKESICTSDNLNSLSSYAESFFFRIMVNCDDYGLMDARPAILRAKCFPLKLDQVSEADIIDWLYQLVDRDLIFLYEVDNKQYLKMTKWENHQQVRSKRSKYPQPDSNGNHMISDDIICHRNPIQSEYESESESKTCAYDTTAENTSIMEEGAQDQADDTGKGEYTNEFEMFWDNYPRKREKKAAFRAWSARIKEKTSQEALIAASKNYKLSCERNRTDEQFIKLAKTFLGRDKPFEEFVSGVPDAPKSNQAYKKTYAHYNDQREYTDADLNSVFANIEDG